MEIIFVRDPVLVMALGKKIKDFYRYKLSYKQKLFLPMAIMLWVLLLAFALFQSNREIGVKRDFLLKGATLANQRVLEHYDEQRDLNMFISSIIDYFDHTLLKDISVVVFDAANGNVLAQGGTLENPRSEMKRGEQSEFFYYKEETSKDGKIIVQTIVPYSEEIEQTVMIGLGWWMLVLLFGSVLTLMIYVTVSHVARNVRALNKFATQAVNNVNIVDFDEFGNDDLGDIGRKILEIYNSRRAAQQTRELELALALKAAEERVRLKKTLTNNMSHELKTPVGIIRGYVDTLLANPDIDDESRQRFLSKTQLQIERLCYLLEDLSTMARLDEGISRIELDDTNFYNLLMNIAYDINESGMIGELEFVIDLPEDTVVKANESLLTGVIMNFVRNSVKYSGATQMGVKVHSRNENYVTFMFYDNGIGVEEEHLPHLFERFYRVDKHMSQMKGGTGLGLPIVKSSINVMGGSISVRNGSECGLEFLFSLRLAHNKPRYR